MNKRSASLSSTPSESDFVFKKLDYWFLYDQFAPCFF